MGPADEERMAEISESLRALADSEIRWARLVGRFRALLPDPAIPRTQPPLFMSSPRNPYALHDAGPDVSTSSDGRR
jgi:hypothetical protein